MTTKTTQQIEMGQDCNLFAERAAVIIDSWAADQRINITDLFIAGIRMYDTALINIDLNNASVSFPYTGRPYNVSVTLDVADESKGPLVYSDISKDTQMALMDAICDSFDQVYKDGVRLDVSYQAILIIGAMACAEATLRGFDLPSVTVRSNKRNIQVTLKSE